MLFYFEHQGVATLLTHLLPGMEKEVQEVQGVTPREEEEAKLEPVRSVSP